MKNINPLGFFDEHLLLERLTKLKEPLMKLEAHIDWAIFLPVLEIAFSKPANKNKMGRPPFDRTMMFKILILQSFYSLPRHVGVRWSTRLLIALVLSDSLV